MDKSEKIEQIKRWLGTGSINIFGKPLAGKDFQGKRLAEMLNGNLIGSGDILRNDNIPKHIKKYMREGKFIPSDDFKSIILPYFSQSHLKNKPLILSSVGRWHGEEESVIKALKSSNHPLKAVVFLDISKEESHKRRLALKIKNDRLNRSDDTEKILDIRFKEFEEKTTPVIDYYKKIGSLIIIDGEPSQDIVTKNIIDELYKIAIE